MEKRIRSLRAELREWSARIALAEESKVGFVGKHRRKLDHRMSIVRSAVKRAEAAPVRKAEQRIAQAEEAMAEVQDIWDRSLPDAASTMTREEV